MHTLLMVRKADLRDSFTNGTFIAITLTVRVYARLTARMSKTMWWARAAIHKFVTFYGSRMSWRTKPNCDFKNQDTPYRLEGTIRMARRNVGSSTEPQHQFR
jgi:hypothetical protein